MKIAVKIIAAATFALFFIAGCSAKSTDKSDADVDIYVQTQTPLQNNESTITPSQTKEPTLSPTTEPTETIVENTSASMGFIGDIMVMESQVRHAREKNGSYNFIKSFEPLRDLLESVDLMCANLETPLAGEAATYSEPAPTMPPATAQNPNPVKPFQTFNAPDSLAYDLKAVGIDMLTTANNHCLDRGINGLKRTVDVIEKAGLLQTGTYRSKKDREKLLITDVNGIKVGILAFSAGFNTFDRQLAENEQFCISKFYDNVFVKSQIEKIRDAGAEYVVVLPHCGTELSLTPDAVHVEMFRQFVKWGADAIVSSHPHVVQPIEFITVKRDSGETVEAPIVYSLGNIISNMAPAPKNYGMFVRIDIEKKDGAVKTVSLKYTPVYCIRQSTSKGTLHQTLPCYKDQSKIEAYEKLDSQELKLCKECRDFVINICGKKYLNDK